MINEIRLPLQFAEVEKQYNQKKEQIESAVAEYEAMQQKLFNTSSIEGTYGDSLRLDSTIGLIHKMKIALNKSAWTYTYSAFQLDRILPTKDKQDYKRAFEHDLPEFNAGNIKATFGDYILNPRKHILRGLAEQFCNLDPAYKSHDKVKIGKKGLPKRVIISGMDSFYSYGQEKLTDVLNALFVYQGKPMADYTQVREFKETGVYNHIIGTGEHTIKRDSGLSLKLFKNGNAHLIFDEQNCKDINKALAEYYGDVLPDTPQENVKKQQSTEVSKDLQYYPTPKAVVDRVLSNVYGLDEKLILEPSCGCGRIMQALKQKGAIVHGIEVDSQRVRECKEKGLHVLQANFLTTPPVAMYDFVIMNPPFYGTHYVKHVEHALKFLKEGGSLIAILPVTARYDHGLLNGRWEDLPVGSFSESGTNVNTTILTIKK